MNRQEMFDVMVKGLAGQDWKQSADTWGVCRYRGSDGLKCAIGQLMPDGPACNYGGSVRQLLGVHPECLGFEVPTEDVQFLMRCQRAHDRPFSTIRRAFEKLAAEYNLTWPEGV